MLFYGKERLSNRNCNMLFELTAQDKHFSFCESIASAQEQAKLEIQCLEETVESIKKLTPECDKLDYALAASSGALCGILDIFLVAKPGQSPIGEITDAWFSDKTMTFAKLCGWKGSGEKSAICFLEKRFKIPYDQRGRGDAASSVKGLSPTNHHFKSLAHNPTLCGLFFSVLDQFENTSHFVSGGQLISLEKADDAFKLQGFDIPSRLFCAFVNWFGHLISDVSGATGSKGRGMGLPSPLWTWSNDVIALKQTLRFPVGTFDETVTELALHIYEKGYDVRFQTAQVIPVFVNEMIVRTVYSIRRLLKYFSETKADKRSFRQLWHACEPFSNPTVKRMLTVAHGTFCLLDLGDATIHGFIAGGGTFDPIEFFLRLNIAGVGRFTISLYGEGKRALISRKVHKRFVNAQREQAIVKNYIEGLNLLAQSYNDCELLAFVQDLCGSDLYVAAFQKTVRFAQLRNVPQERILHTKADIDSYFRKR